MKVLKHSQKSKPDLDIFINKIPSRFWFIVDSDFNRQDMSRHFSGATGILYGGEFRSITLKLPPSQGRTGDRNEI